MKGERIVAGLRCGEVLAELSEYLDGQLAPESVEAIQAHLRGCDSCERFGGRFAATIKALREQLSNPQPLDEEVARRLRKRLAEE